ncbi:LysR substrate-binding domain-containing protein [Promicromonospora sp. Marseille-Q5078]
MDEQTLRVFLSLCETESTRDTAALLRVDQSTVSRTLARLEAGLGVELFRRHGRRIALNRAGVGFRGDAARVLDEIEVARRHVRQQALGARTVRLGFLQSVARWLVPRIVTELRRDDPARRFELRQGFAQDLFGWLDDDVLDLALVTPPPPTRTTGWRLLHEQVLCVAVPPGHRLAGRAGVEVADLQGERFVAFSRTTELRGVVEGMLGAQRVEVEVAFESSEVDTIRGLVAAGLGVAVLPRPERPDAADPVYVPLRPRTTRRLGVAWPDRSRVPAPARVLTGS